MGAGWDLQSKGVGGAKAGSEFNRNERGHLLADNMALPRNGPEPSIAEEHLFRMVSIDVEVFCCVCFGFF